MTSPSAGFVAPVATCVSAKFEETERALSAHRRRRGVAKASITRLTTRLQRSRSQRKWNSSEAVVLRHVAPERRDSQSLHPIPDPDEYTKTLGVQWNSGLDHFQLTVVEFPKTENLTKRLLVSDIAMCLALRSSRSRFYYNVYGSSRSNGMIPSPLKSKAPGYSGERSLRFSHIPRCYYPKQSRIQSVQLHGFSDAAYSGVVYLRMVDSLQCVYTCLVTSKTKVAPIKRLTIPRLELCGARLLAQLLHHVQGVFHLPVDSVYAWTDGMIVLSWLVGNPRRFKTYIGNRVSHTIELIPPDRWNHVKGTDNPADCASRGLFPSELLDHEL